MVVGNGGTSTGSSKVHNVDIVYGSRFEGILSFVALHKVYLVVVGPEQPLVEGLADVLHEAGVLCFGPSAKAAEIEASKAWSKAFMARHKIPTATFASFTRFAEAYKYIQSLDYNVVVKASGLAAGKGVLIPASKEEAVAAAYSILEDKQFGEEAGRELVIEQFIAGEEVSVLAFCDGRTTVCMPGAQDHKRVFDGDKGPNTGGMGAYAPAPILTPALQKQCAAIIQQTVDALAAEGRPFKGVLYAGFMITNGEEVRVLEYNCRFGDPETQVLLPLLQSDLFRICEACCTERLTASLVAWEHNKVACTVVCAAPGYPESYPSGSPISGLTPLSSSSSSSSAFGSTSNGVSVFQAGTRAGKEGEGGQRGALTSGGRVLAVTGVGCSIHQARRAAYRRIADISFEGMHYRRDIGHRALSLPLLIGVLGSTRGSSLQPVIDAIENGSFNAKIVLVLSNKESSGILERAGKHSIPALFISSKGKSREVYDTEVSSALEMAGAQLILMAGYMRIVSPSFVARWRGVCVNVHPSLLPEFAGGMDLEVHRAVIDAKKSKSGCSVHLVTDEVDGGPVLLQSECAVLPNDTPESLKARVQALEGTLLVEALRLLWTGDRTSNHSQKSSQPFEVLTYKAAGVDIDAGEALVDAIKPYCKATRRSGCDADLGGFGGLFDLAAAGFDAKDTILVSGTDGVGTKLKIAQSTGIHDTIGIDLVAMCVNDILVCGAEPLFFLDYYATGALQVNEAAAVVKGIADGCLLSGCGLIGGETAEMSGMYARGEYDLAGFAVGAVSRSKVLPKGVGAGDVLIGLRSSGVHSNGYSLVRKCVEKSGLQWTDPAPFVSSSSATSSSLGAALLTPTRIYVKALLPLIREGLLKGLAHITGGGVLDNLPRVLPADVEAHINVAEAGWELPPVFQWLQSLANLPQEELLRTFNCGIGMILVVSEQNVGAIMERLAEENPMLLGKLIPRSAADSPQVVLAGTLS